MSLVKHSRQISKTILEGFKCFTIKFLSCCRTYKNLEKRVILECDGEAIPLPSLQGIVVMNISSFMGGTNFWGNAKEDSVFLPSSFDDGILEVSFFALRRKRLF